MVGLAAPGATSGDPEARGQRQDHAARHAVTGGTRPHRPRDGHDARQGRAFLKRQRQVLRRLFAWSDARRRRRSTCKPLFTPLGWTIRFRPGTSAKSPERTGRNFCIQGPAADMMRLLMIRLTEAGVAVCRSDP